MQTGILRLGSRKIIFREVFHLVFAVGDELAALDIGTPQFRDLGLQEIFIRILGDLFPTLAFAVKHPWSLIVGEEWALEAAVTHGAEMTLMHHILPGHLIHEVGETASHQFLLFSSRAGDPITKLVDVKRSEHVFIVVKLFSASFADNRSPVSIIHHAKLPVDSVCIGNDRLVGQH